VDAPVLGNRYHMESSGLVLRRREVAHETGRKGQREESPN
jgi:hypothetical protein